MKIFIILMFALVPVARAELNVLSSQAEMISKSGVERPLKKSPMELTHVEIDYRYNKLYFVDGNDEDGANVYILSIRPFAKIGLIPEATNLSFNTSKYFFVYKKPSLKRNNDPKLENQNYRFEVRLRELPQKILAKKSNSDDVDIIGTCFDSANMKWLSNYASYDFSLNKLSNYEFIKTKKVIRACWLDGTILGDTVGSDNKAAYWISTQPTKTYPFKIGVGILIGQKFKAASMANSRITNGRFELELLDFTAGKYVKVPGRVNKASEEFKNIIFAGYSRDHESAYFTVGTYGRRWHNIYGQQVFKLSYVSGQWVMKEVDVSKLVSVYKLSSKEPLGIQWVVE